MPNKKLRLSQATVGATIGAALALLPFIAYASTSCGWFRLSHTYSNRTFVFDEQVLDVLTGFILISIAIVWFGKALRMLKANKSKELVNTANANLIFSGIYSLLVLVYITFRISFFSSLYQLFNRAFINPSWFSIVEDFIEPNYTCSRYSLNLRGRVLLATLVFGILIILAILVYRQFVKYKNTSSGSKMQQYKPTNPWTKAFLIDGLIVLFAFVIIIFLLWVTGSNWSNLGSLFGY